LQCKSPGADFRASQHQAKVVTLVCLGVWLLPLSGVPGAPLPPEMMWMHLASGKALAHL
jgi:hypothetical protein